MSTDPLRDIVDRLEQLERQMRMANIDRWIVIALVAVAGLLIWLT